MKYVCIIFVLSIAGIAQAASPTPVSILKLGDLDGNGIVNIFDYNELLADFGTLEAQEHSNADLNQDGEVDLDDVHLLITNFGR